MRLRLGKREREIERDSDPSTLGALLAVISWEGYYHRYEPNEQADGSIIYAHTSVWSEDGLESTCPACLLIDFVQKKEAAQAAAQG